MQIQNFVRRFHTNQILLSLKKFLELLMENAHFRAILKNLLCDQDNFSIWKILYKWDILRRKQSTATRSTIWYILQRMGWVTRGRFSNLWAAACKVQTKVAIEHIWSRSTSSQLVDEKVSFEILCMEAFLLNLEYGLFFCQTLGGNKCPYIRDGEGKGVLFLENIVDGGWGRGL